MDEAPTCPICHSRRGERVVESRGWKYQTCGRCGHWWLTPFPTEEELTEYYRSRYEYPAARAVGRRYLPLVQRWGPRMPGVVIDHGCNRGELLAALQPYGWHTFGIEPSQPFATQAASRPGVTLAATAGEAQNAGWPTADLVLSFHTIEHVRDSRRELELLRRLMRAGGALVLLTPNVRSLNARLFPGEWEWTSPPVHLHLFSRESLSRVLKETGFRVRQCRTARGNAKGFLFELLRSGAHHLTAMARGSTVGTASGPLRSTRPWYRTAEALTEATSLPFWLLSPVYRALGLAPELQVLATAE